VRDLKALFLDHQQNFQAKETSIYTDGSKDNNNVGCAAILDRQSILRKLMCKSIGLGVVCCFTASLILLFEDLDFQSKSS
jgi:hypothetical protein